MKGIVPYLNFDGDCRQAMSFYQQCLGGELDVRGFSDGQFDGSLPPGAQDRVMHARLDLGPVVIMASDTMPGMPFQRGNGVWLNLECESGEEVDALYGKLSEGGRGVMPPADTFWGAYFAMLTDRHGVGWMLNHERGGRG